MTLFQIQFERSNLQYVIYGWSLKSFLTTCWRHSLIIFYHIFNWKSPAFIWKYCLLHSENSNLWYSYLIRHVQQSLQNKPDANIFKKEKIHNCVSFYSINTLPKLDQRRPTCGPGIFLCGPNWIQNSKKNGYFDRFSLGFW